MPFPEFEPIPEFNPEFAEFTPDSPHELIDLMESLLKYASIPEERKEQLYRDIYSMAYEDSIKLINELQEKQVNRIHAGINYNMTYIKAFMKKSI